MCGWGRWNEWTVCYIRIEPERCNPGESVQGWDFTLTMVRARAQSMERHDCIMFLCNSPQHAALTAGLVWIDHKEWPNFC